MWPFGNFYLDTPARFRTFVKGGTLGGDEGFPPNQVGKLVDSQDTWVFVSGKVLFFRKIWGVGPNKARTLFLMYWEMRARDFRITHVSWIHMHQYRLAGVTTAADWVGLGGVFWGPLYEVHIEMWGAK